MIHIYIIFNNKISHHADQKKNVNRLKTNYKENSGRQW